MLRQGVLGIKVKIMKGHDPEGHAGPRKPLPDSVTILDPPVDKIVTEPLSEQREPISVPSMIPQPPDQTYDPPDAGYQPDAYAEQAVF
jgi:small subunit ribosomal protein S3e